MENNREGFRDICNIGDGFKRAEDYYRTDFNTSEASTITEVETSKELGPCYRYSRPHFQNNYTT